MVNNNLVCPACGAPIDPKHRFEEAYTCPFCGTQTYFGSSHAVAIDQVQEGVSVESLRDSAILTQVLSRFHLGGTGKIMISGQWYDYSVTGRLMYEYDGGYWNEWYLNVGGRGYWLQEDEGLYLLFFENSITEKYFKNLEGIRKRFSNYLKQIDDGEDILLVGHELPPLMDNMPNWVSIQFGKARLVGFEGMLPEVPDPSKLNVIYIDGVAKLGEGYYSLEITEDGSSYSINNGYPLEFNQIQTSEEMSNHEGGAYS